MGKMASQITSVTIVYSTVYSGADQINIKTTRHWPLWGESTGDRWIPRTKGQNMEKFSIWWHHHALFDMDTTIGYLAIFLIIYII